MFISSLARQRLAREIRGDCQFPDSKGLPVSSIEIPCSVSTLSHSLTLTLTVSQSPINRIFEFLTFDFSNFQKFNVYVWNKCSGVSISTKKRLHLPKFLTYLNSCMNFKKYLLDIDRPSVSIIKETTAKCPFSPNQWFHNGVTITACFIYIFCPPRQVVDIRGLGAGLDEEGFDRLCEGHRGGSHVPHFERTEEETTTTNAGEERQGKPGRNCLGFLLLQFWIGISQNNE